MVKSALKINKKDRLGIFSGSFDPPHKGHLYISKIFIKKIKLKKLIWSVSKKNPLVEKSYFYNHNQRINLSKKITKNISKIFINNFDKKYSYQLINSIKKKYKNNKIFFLIGADNIKYFHLWKNYKKILSDCTLVIISRPGYQKEIKRSQFFKKNQKYLLKNYDKLNIFPSKTWIYIKDKGIKISSSNIKNRLYKKKLD